LAPFSGVCVNADLRSLWLPIDIRKKLSGASPFVRLRVAIQNTGDVSMSEFTYLFRGREVSPSPEQMQKTMQKWVAWFKDLGAKGHLKDPGHPLEHTGKVVSGKQKAVNDGPYAEAKDVVGGYIVVEAADLNQAVELSKGCPILEVGGSVEVRPNQRINM
jgi:hypothetical protein